MGDFFSIGSKITQNLIEGFASFWEWFISPLFSIDLTWLLPNTDPITIAPWMVISFSTLMFIFAVSLFHLLNPIG